MRPVTTRQRDRWWTRWVPQPVYGLQELSELFTTHRAAALHRIATLGALQRVYSPNEGEQLGPGVSAEAARTLFRLADRVIVLNLLLEVPRRVGIDFYVFTPTVVRIDLSELEILGIRVAIESESPVGSVYFRINDNSFFSGGFEGESVSLRNDSYLYTKRRKIFTDTTSFIKLVNKGT